MAYYWLHLTTKIELYCYIQIQNYSALFCLTTITAGSCSNFCFTNKCQLLSFVYVVHLSCCLLFKGFFSSQQMLLFTSQQLLLFASQQLFFTSLYLSCCFLYKKLVFFTSQQLLFS
jgi:hypothetical protein